MVKIKNRYYLAQMITNDGKELNVTKGQTFQEIMKTTTEMFGDIGYSLIKMSLSVRVIDENVVVIRVALAAERYLSTVLPCILKINKQPLVIKTIFIGRSMRACEKRLIQFRRDELLTELSSCKTAVERSKILSAIRKVCGKPGKIFDDAELRLQDLIA